MSLETPLFNSSNESENVQNDDLTFHNACAEGNLKVVKVYFAQQGFDMNVGYNDGKLDFIWLVVMEI